MNPQYKDYNYVKVTIITNSESYVISNVNTKGLPGENCGAHLQALEIKEPVTGSNNPSDISSSGSVTIIDYADSVFAVLNKHMQQFLGNPEVAMKQELLPKIKIEIRCFTNSRTFVGHILDWNMQFSGTIPSIQLNWSLVIPSNEPIEYPKPGYFYTPKALINEVTSKYKDDKVSFIMEDGSDAADKIKFINDKIDFDLTKLETTGNKLVDTYRHIISNSTTLDGKSLTGELVAVDKFMVFINNPQQNAYSTEEGNTSTNLIFIQNGKYKEYTEVDKRYVIPMTSFSFETNMYQLPIQSKIIGNANGTMSVGNNGASLNVGSTNNISNEATIATSNNASDPITVTFECYNTMAFSLNNVNAMVKYDVYNELGKKHILSGFGMPRECSYSLDGAVIKAKVTCTEVFNSLSQGVEEGVSVNFTEASVSSSGSPVPNYSSLTSNSQYVDMTPKQYLCKEDSIITSLLKDETASLLGQGGLFRECVKEFLNSYGSTTSANRTIDKYFVENLCGCGNYGLLSLLIAVANYGVTDAPPEWNLDAVNLDQDYKNKAPFCASNTGKAPYDYKKGGLGIAHWDSGNLEDIYTNIGFPSNLTGDYQNYFKQLLVTDNSITGWKDGYYEGIPRKMPVFNVSHPKMRLFDKGLKQDPEWLNWAYSILYYKTDTGEPIFQYYLFELWVKKFWIPTVETLKSKPPKDGHTPSLQDAVRISRAGNSATGLIAQSCGKTVAEQYAIYYGDKDRYVRQKSFCRRCADIIGWINS